MTNQSETPEIHVITAKQARSISPENNPITVELWRKVMTFTFHIIDKRAEAGYKYVEAGLTQFPALEARRMKVLKRLGYTVREHEFALFIGWENE